MTFEEIDTAEKEGEFLLTETIKRINPERIETEIIQKILIQRHWLSHIFTPIYDIALNFLSPDSKSAKVLIRGIIREEYPDLDGHTRSHREDLIEELKMMGIAHSLIVNSPPTIETSAVIEEAFSMVFDFSKKEYSDVMLIAFLRYWGEVLTAVEYRLFWPRIEKLLDGKKSVFYRNHIDHDRNTVKFSKLHNTPRGGTHADHLGRKLDQILRTKKFSNNDAIDAVLKAVEKSADNKVLFYKQFNTSK